MLSCRKAEVTPLEKTKALPSGCQRLGRRRQWHLTNPSNAAAGPIGHALARDRPSAMEVITEQ